jgi:hypothetical protein
MNRRQPLPVQVTSAGAEAGAMNPGDTSMKTRSLTRAAAMAALAVALTGPAAAATYDLELDGTAQYFPLCYWDIPTCTGGQPPPVYYDWRGQLELTFDPPRDPAADPVPVAITLRANGGSFSYSMEDSALLSSQVTLVDGRVTSIDAVLPSPYGGAGLIDFFGLRLGLEDPGSHHHGGTNFNGTLTAVPEPVATPMMLAGTAFVAALAFLRRRSA